MASLALVQEYRDALEELFKTKVVKLKLLLGTEVSRETSESKNLLNTSHVGRWSLLVDKSQIYLSKQLSMRKDTVEMGKIARLQTH